MHNDLMKTLNELNESRKQIVNQGQQIVAESQQVKELKNEVKELWGVNKVLYETINRQDQKNQELNDKISSLKPFQRCIKSSLACLCRFCNAYFPTEQFVEHIKSC